MFPPRWSPAGSNVLVTGASSGIGRQLTLQLTTAGARVIAVARRGDRLDELTAACPPGRVVPIVGDVTTDGCRDEAFAAIGSIGGHLEAIINNAGIGGVGRFDEAPATRARQIMEVNYFAPLAWIRDGLPHLRGSLPRHPVICNIGSVLGHRAVPLKSEYSASKFALHGFSDALRVELSPQIAVTLVSPSTTRSEFFDVLVDTAEGVGRPRPGGWTPAKVANATIAAMIRRRAEVILSPAGKALVLGDRIAPGLLDRLLGRYIR